jgi:hypothetical protein
MGFTLAEKVEGEVEGCGAGAQRDGVGSADLLLKFSLKAVDVRAEGCDPVGDEGVGDEGLLVAGHVGEGVVDAMEHT